MMIISIHDILYPRGTPPYPTENQETPTPPTVTGRSHPYAKLMII